jgi:serine/threonine-protein kinase
VLELVGRYRIQERIGEGAMADVYRAHDPSISRSLAIKILKAEFRQNKEYSARFLREAKAAGALSHPNIVTIYDVGEVEGYPYILMELLEGEPLNDVMTKTGPLAADQVMQVGLQLADALRYAHSQGVVHRDIKPSNIMMDRRGAIKILDFGIARMTEVEGLLEADSLKTQVGQVLGTPRYMSPEQALGQSLDGRSDLFSVGVILYELLTGKKAFAGVSAATLALQITQEDPEAISKFAPEAPRGLQFIINKLLAKKPDRRFADGAQLAEALRRELGVWKTVQDEAAASKQRYLPLQVRLTLMLGAITAVVLVGSIGTVLLRQYRALEQMAITSGSAVASFVASNAALSAADNATLPPDQRDWQPVNAFVKVASEDPNVVQMMVVDSDGVVRAANEPGLVDKPYVAHPDETIIRSEEGITIAETRSAQGQPAFRFVKPITYAGRLVGKVDVSLSKKELQSTAVVTRSLMITLGLVILAVILAATYGLSRMLATPIRRLNSAFHEASKGDLDFRISHSRKDEFGELFDAFNRLTQHVQDRLDAVESVAMGATAADSTVVKTARLSETSKPAELDKSLLSSPFAPPADPAPVAAEAPPAMPEPAPEPQPAAEAPPAPQPEAPPQPEPAPEPPAPVLTDDDPILAEPLPPAPQAEPELPPAPSAEAEDPILDGRRPFSPEDSLWPSDEDHTVIRRTGPRKK